MRQLDHLFLLRGSKNRIYVIADFPFRSFLDRQSEIKRRIIHCEDRRSDLDRFRYDLDGFRIDILRHHEYALLDQIQEIAENENVRINDSFLDQRHLILLEGIYVNRETNLLLSRVVFLEGDGKTRKVCLFQLAIHIIDHFLEKIRIRPWRFLVDEIIIPIEISYHIAVIIDLIWIQITVIQVDKDILLSSLCKSLHLLLHQ